tara:strand:- start:805 stop:1242 length:438 start_codon:yes stop_codon:yes gene_type:complete
MKYVKHYWIDAVSNEWLTTTNDAPNGKSHPYNIFSQSDLSVKIWLTDSDGIGVCLSELPDSVTISEVVVGSKKAVIQLTETQYNTVKTPYDAAGVLSIEADALRKETIVDGDVKQVTAEDESAVVAKDTEADAKITEAKTALNTL